MTRTSTTTRLGLASAWLLAASLAAPCWSQEPNAQSYFGPTPAAPYAAPAPYPSENIPTAPVSDGMSWTLDQLVQCAEQNNPSIRKAAAQIDSARGDAVQAGLYPNPSFDTNNPQIISGQHTQITGGVIQQIVVKGKLRLDRAAAEQAVAQAELAYVTARFDVLTDLRSQFYSVLAAERRLAVQYELVTIADASRRAAEGRVRALEGTQTDVLLLTVELQRAEVAALNMQTQLEGLRHKLAATAGIPELPIASTVGELFGNVPSFNQSEVQQFILDGNSEVQNARIDIARHRLLVRRAEVEPYPNPTIGPTYYSGLYSVTSAPVFGITTIVPLPTWDRNQGNIQSERGDLVASSANLGVVQNALLGDAMNTLARYRAARQLADRIATEILPNARRSLELTRSGYDRGLLDISTLLQAQRSLIQSNMDLIDAQETVWSTAAELSGILQRQQFP